MWPNPQETADLITFTEETCETIFCAVKAIMNRSKLKNKSNRTKLQGGIAKYKKQQNLVAKLNKSFGNIKTSNNLKPFSNEFNENSDSKIIFIEKEKITNNSNEVIKKETLLVNND